MNLTAGQLAQYRGCETWNECYGECVESAQWSLENPDVNDNAAEIADATAWAAEQRWFPENTSASIQERNPEA